MIWSVPSCLCRSTAPKSNFKLLETIYDKVDLIGCFVKCRIALPDMSVPLLWNKLRYFAMKRVEDLKLSEDGYED